MLFQKYEGGSELLANHHDAWMNYRITVIYICNFVPFFMALQLLFVYFNLGTQIQSPGGEWDYEDQD